jgi:hypothetical protein
VEKMFLLLNFLCEAGKQCDALKAARPWLAWLSPTDFLYMYMCFIHQKFERSDSRINPWLMLVLVDALMAVNNSGQAQTQY